MANTGKKWLIAGAIALGLGVANPAFAQQAEAVRAPSAAAMGVDTLLVRPLSFVATVAGAGLFVVSLPFSALGGNVGAAGKALVVEPGAYTFVRPLGDFEGAGEAHSRD